MTYTRTQMLDSLEEVFEEAEAGKFPDIETALQVAVGALKYLVDQCDDEESS